MAPPSPELLEARHFLVLSGLCIAVFTLVGTLVAAAWMRRQRRKAPEHRRGPPAALAFMARMDALSQRPRHTGGLHPKLGLFVGLLGLLAILNVVAHLIMTAWIGGTAIAGQAVNGHYYVSSHGHLTEVSEAMFTFNKWHTHSVWLMWLILALSVLLYSRLWRRG